MRKIMLWAGLAGWAVAGVALGVQSASAGTAHQSVPRWLAVYRPARFAACDGRGVLVFARPSFVQRALVCEDGQVFVR